MNTMKTVLFAGLTVLSIGTAMAQEGGDAYPMSAAPQATKASVPAPKVSVQSGSSDADVAPTPAPMHWRDLPSYPGQG